MKNTNKKEDNVNTKNLLPLIKEFLEKVDINFDSMNTTIEEFEFESYSGFSAFHHNRGGMDLIAITTNGYLIGSGTHIGTSIEKQVEDSYSAICKQAVEEGLVDGTDKFYERVDSYQNDDYSGQAFRVRLMYEGDNTLVVYAGWDDDAPYFRWSNKPELEKTIKFKNKRDLKTKLNKLLKKISKLN